jgi:creatinine amidohydrolase
MQLQDMSWPAVAALSRDIPVAVPIAALEQHGKHLPVFTDSMLLGEVVRRASSTLGDRVLWAPLMWLGNSHHHLDFAGTLSASPRVYLDLLADLLENLLNQGFRRLVLLNGHGGNIVPSSQVVFEVRQRHRRRDDLLLLSATYWTLGEGRIAGRENLGAVRFEQSRMGHACEWETSMMLRLAPHLVGDLSEVEPVAPGAAFEPATRGWTTNDRSAPGHIGNPRAATAEKGEVLFREFGDGVVAFFERVSAWDGRSWDG